MAYHSGIIEEKDEEFTQLLKKIADMEIEDFPSNILEQIKNIWETCHQDISTIHHF
ncbi:hypothetical protein Godav_018146 [Gossypium davidsonii]|uniref:Uncharacterized protein n=1 Tax=Gossypium davidsonii TaxID=34287 RepID=A0A7J8QVI1_GOSDV|nr:hypothetical protein [Gossypium davidsonii]